ncbi:MAG: DUF1385 domain-containing protein [Candidatus Cloacimonetes bacterium]|nr:DUF1385 domain-containing protein [Candidatus Cloacimonadota bacterium]MBL7086874.1 DUF1385 domain-containing protein [Candidatus Cloacimonadota bacterium]
MKNKPELAIGGQAVIEGVMMRSQKFIATAIRKKDNHIIIKKEEFISITKKNKILCLPIIRGFVSLIEMLIIGVKSLNFSAEEAIKDEEDEPKKSDKKNKTKGKYSKLYQTFSYIIAFGLAFLFFIYLPYQIAYWLNIEKNSFGFNLFVGIVRIIFFVTYIFAISLLKDIRRLFEYHGAEHKTVFAYERNPNFVLKDTKKFKTFHPRCGTSFIFIVLIIAILVFSIFDGIIFSILGYIIPLPLRMLLHILLIPVISGLSYEILKFSGKNINHWLVKIFSAPGLALQRITTKEPDDNQLEVAICALKAALEMTVDCSNVEFINQPTQE